MSAASDAATVVRLSGPNRLGLRLVACPPPAADLVESPFGHDEFRARLDLSCHGVTLALLGHGDRLGKRLECVPHATAARAYRIDPSEQRRDRVDAHRQIDVLPFELAHQREELRIAVCCHRLSIAHDSTASAPANTRYSSLEPRL